MAGEMNTIQTDAHGPSSLQQGYIFHVNAAEFLPAKLKFRSPEMTHDFPAFAFRHGVGLYADPSSAETDNLGM
jgi:hypothetical protein